MTRSYETLVLQLSKLFRQFLHFQGYEYSKNHKKMVKTRQTRTRERIECTRAGRMLSSKEWNSGDDQLRLRWMIYLVVLADAAESVRDTIGFEYYLASLSGWTKSPVLWAEIKESSLTGPELVLDTTYKVVLIKEKLKAARDRQKSYADKRRKPLEFEVGDGVLLKVSLEGVSAFLKEGGFKKIKIEEEDDNGGGKVNDIEEEDEDGLNSVCYRMSSSKFIICFTTIALMPLCFAFAVVDEDLSSLVVKGEHHEDVKAKRSG
ncbi:hypothetical protein Tco_0824728 [Tanacetum coccineum]|uniref:Reverse transcriptase domain-containing protein n=1 Tax=Tanacetum coccineum TaxID=301880 RepID=A0ABQ5AND2_9ASTR